MDKNAIKKYAVWARRELITRVTGRAAQYGVTEQGWGNADAESTNGHVLSAKEKKQRTDFIKKVQSEGYEQAVEEAAYTWFNRFCALRYMEVNGYLPSHVRVFTNESGEFKPEILDEAIHLDIEGLDMDRVMALKEDAQRSEDLFRYLLITQCNALYSILPGIFQKIEDYTELLLPDNLLRKGSVLEQLIVQIPEADWTDQVQIIGWLYQYYNVEKKDEVFATLKKNVKIAKENIPAATQLFTPDWIVRYMVENSLGRLWIEGHPNDDLKSGWKYYLDEAKQEPEVEAQLAEIRKEYATLKPEDIKCIDPCCGSGHILCYMFDVLMQIYESYGYTAQEAVGSIVENNLYGLDIDERAAQLAYFAVMMKARSYDRRFFSRGIQPHVYAICESNELDQNVVDYFAGDDPKLKKNFKTLVKELHDAKEYGSILNISQLDFDTMYARLEEVKNDISLYSSAVIERILPLLQVGEALTQKYDVVVTNPPYMGSSNMGSKLSHFIKNNFPDSKGDLYAVFMEQCFYFTKEDGYLGMITQHTWMFLSSLEQLRKKFLSKEIINMAHLGIGIFEDLNSKVVQSVSFVLANRNHITGYKGNYNRLFERQGLQENNYEKANWLITGKHSFIVDQSKFMEIPESPLAYWVSDRLLTDFSIGTALKIDGDTRQGMATSDNNRFLRLWHEVAFEKVGLGCSDSDEALSAQKKWYPYNKGGEFRKWFGNLDFVVNYENDGREVKDYAAALYKTPTRTIKSISEYFKPCLSWSKISSSNIAFRYYPKGFIFDVAGCCIFYSDEKLMFYDFGFLNSKVASTMLAVISPTLNYEAGHIASLPIIRRDSNYEEIKALVWDNIMLAKKDWDAFETSWDFIRHPLIQSNDTIASIYTTWEADCNDRFNQLKANEEELNRIFINIYGLQDELIPEEEDRDVTVRKADLQRDVKSLISYAIGCMFGRYSLDVDGLAYAGGEWDPSKYKTYQPDYNGILPICEDEYFTDDIVGHFVDFIRTVYGEDTLEENLQFIADALGGSGSSREVIRRYFLNDFFADHCKIYQKRPIYWLFDSGKKNGFKCLIYMHRYRPDTIARIRTDYVHEQQARYRTAIEDVEKRITDVSTSDRIKLNKQLKKLQDQSDELHGYEEKIHHLADQFIDIDLDDGVKVNYTKFQDVMAKIK